MPFSLFGTYSPQERPCCPRVQWLRMGRRPRFHELAPVYVQRACDSAETSIYLSQPTCELWHPTLVPLTMDSQPNGSANLTPVGLSDPQYAARRRRMFEFLTRVCALGCVPQLGIPATSHRSLLQSRRRSGYSCNRGHRLAERRKILPHRGNFWYYTPTCQWYLHSVSPSEPPGTNWLIVRNIDVRQSANSHTPMLHGRVQFRCS